MHDKADSLLVIPDRQSTVIAIVRRRRERAKTDVSLNFFHCGMIDVTSCPTVGPINSSMMSSLFFTRDAADLHARNAHSSAFSPAWFSCAPRSTTLHKWCTLRDNPFRQVSLKDYCAVRKVRSGTERRNERAPKGEYDELYGPDTIAKPFESLCALCWPGKCAAINLNSPSSAHSRIYS